MQRAPANWQKTKAKDYEGIPQGRKTRWSLTFEKML